MIAIAKFPGFPAKFSEIGSYYTSFYVWFYTFPRRGMSEEIIEIKSERAVRKGIGRPSELPQWK